MVQIYAEAGIDIIHEYFPIERNWKGTSLRAEPRLPKTETLFNSLTTMDRSRDNDVEDKTITEPREQYTGPPQIQKRLFL